MERSRSPLNQTVTAAIAAFLVVGGIAVSAVAFKYAGKIQFSVGPNGIQLQINGRSE